MYILFKKVLFFILIFCLIISICSCKDDAQFFDDKALTEDEANEETPSVIELNLRIHIMTGITMVHPTGKIMENWVTVPQVKEIIIPELNTIWKQANINWNIESVIQEEVVKTDSYQESLVYVVNTTRDANGRSDPARLPHLYSLIQPANMSPESLVGKNLFHIYLFPFIGNTSQGNAMAGFDYHSVVGTWTNKHNRGGVPEKVLLTEDQNNFDRGSLSRTIAHELGHVLNLRHQECMSRCLMGGRTSDGYLLSDAQVIRSRIEATMRSIE